MNIDLIDRAAAEGQAREEVVDRFLITAEEETGKGLWTLLHLTNGGINVLIGEDREKRSKDLVLHDWIVPCHGIKDRGIDIARLRVGRTSCDDLLLIDEADEALDSLCANHS